MKLDRKSALVGLAAGIVLMLLVLVILLLARPASDRYDFKIAGPQLSGMPSVYVFDRQTGNVWRSMIGGDWRLLGGGLPSESEPRATTRPATE